MKEKLKYIIPSFWTVLLVVFSTLLAFHHTSSLSIEVYSFLIVLITGLIFISSEKGFVEERFSHPESKTKLLFLFPPFTFLGVMKNFD